MSKGQKNLEGVLGCEENVPRAVGGQIGRDAEDRRVIVADHAPELPSLGHQLLRADVPGSEGWIRISPVKAQRMRMMLVLFVQGILISACVLAILYGPDFIMDYAHRGADFVTFFGKFFGLAVILVSVAAFLAMTMRASSFFIHPAERKIASARRLNEKSASEAVSIDSIEKIEIAPPSALLKRARLILVIDRVEVTIAETYGDDDDLVAVRDLLLSLREREGGEG